MKRILILAITIIALHSTYAATRRALVIGIGDYPAESGWAKINGDKDIPLVEDMLITNGFNKQNIVELKNEQATYSAITAEFEKLISKAGNGDYIYIHFSGHGQQITDINGDETDDALDEAWIPYDAQFSYSKGMYEGQNHLVDDQLNSYFHRLREKIGKDGKLVIVADACHSGSGSRGDDEEYVVRGTASAFIIPSESKKSTNEAQSYKIEWTFISACKPYQVNYEYKGNGSLTYALYQQRTNFSKFTSTEMRRKISACISDIIPFTQTPVLEVLSGTEKEIFF